MKTFTHEDLTLEIDSWGRGEIWVTEDDGNGTLVATAEPLDGEVNIRIEGGPRSLFRRTRTPQEVLQAVADHRAGKMV